MADWLGPNVAPEELVFFVVSAIGIVHHWIQFRRAWLRRGWQPTQADAVLLRIHLRHELSRIALKLVFLYGAALMLLAPPSSSLAVTLPEAIEGWRLGLIAIALWLDIESFLTARDRRSIVRLEDPHA